jgi:hypothetical protein
MISQKIASLEARIAKLEANQKQASWMSSPGSKHELFLDMKNEFLSNIDVKKIKDLLNMKTKKYGLDFILESTGEEGHFSVEQFKIVCSNLDKNLSYPPIYFEFWFTVTDEKLFIHAGAWLPKNSKYNSPDAEDGLTLPYTKKGNVNLEVVEFLLDCIDQVNMNYPH